MKKMESERVSIACPRSHIWSTKAGIQTQSLHQAAETDDSSGDKKKKKSLTGVESNPQASSLRLP